MSYQQALYKAGNTNAAPQVHSTIGVFGEDCALDRRILAHFPKPQGILSMLPAAPTRLEIVRYGAITGFEPDGSAEPDFPCDAAPKGAYSTCRLQFELGRIKRDSETIEIDAAIRRAHQGDTDFILQGRMLGDALGGWQSGMIGEQSPQQVLNNTTLLQLQQMANNFSLELSKMVWSGDPSAPAPANTANGGKRSFAGFDLLIDETVIDAVTSNACPTMGSIIEDFNFGNACEGTVTINGEALNIAQLLSYLEWKITTLASSSYLDPVRWVLAMRPELFHAITACYPCMYYTDRCSDPAYPPTGSGTIVRMNDGFMVEQRDAMRNGMFLPINGRTYQVVIDWGIRELTTADDAINLPNAYDRASSIYFIPLTVMGNTPVTFMRYMDYRYASAERAILTANGMPAPFIWTDDGRFMLSYSYNNFCYDMTAKIEPGLVFRTPQLAFKIENILYNAIVDLRSPYPSDAGFLIDTVMS